VKLFRLIGSMLFLTAALNGCGGAPPNTNDSTPRAKASPASISGTAEVVRLNTQSPALSVGGSTDLKVMLTISPGFHVNANPATFSYLIATELTTGKADGIQVGTPVYPPAQKKKFQFAEEPLAVYQGEVPIKLNVSVNKNSSPGTRTLPITLRVQACDEEKCYPPATLNTTISLTVK
jgi:thioredoxin:protein disulfide reductase